MEIVTIIKSRKSGDEQVPDLVQKLLLTDFPKKSILRAGKVRFVPNDRI